MLRDFSCVVLVRDLTRGTGLPSLFQLILLLRLLHLRCRRNTRRKNVTLQTYVI